MRKLCKEEHVVLQALSGKDVKKALDICNEVLSLLSLSSSTWNRPWDWCSAHMSVIVDMVDKVAKELNNNFSIAQGMMLRNRCSLLCRSWRSTLPMDCMAMIDKEMDQEEERLSKAAFYLAKIRATLEEFPSLDFDEVHENELWRLLVENHESEKGEGRRRDEEQDKSPEPCHVLDQATSIKEQMGGETIYRSFEAEPHRAIGLRPIVIDGPSVAFCHGKDKVFSAKGIKLVIEYFKMRGHQKIVAYVPELWRKHWIPKFWKSSMTKMWHCYIKCPFLGLGASFGQFSSNDISFHHELIFAMGLEF